MPVFLICFFLRLFLVIHPGSVDNCQPVSVDNVDNSVHNLKMGVFSVHILVDYFHKLCIAVEKVAVCRSRPGFSIVKCKRQNIFS